MNNDCASCGADTTTDLPGGDPVSVCPGCWAQIVGLIGLIKAADLGAYDSIHVWQLCQHIPDGMD